MLTRGLLAATLAIGRLAGPRDAQIYAWRDANGTLVLSDRSIDRPTQVYEVEGAPRYVSTTPVESTSARELYEPYVLEHSNKQSLRPHWCVPSSRWNPATTRARSLPKAPWG
jgi:hypothetical protein